MRACVTTSRPVVGSSSTTSGGSQTSASAIAAVVAGRPRAGAGSGAGRSGRTEGGPGRGRLRPLVRALPGRAPRSTSRTCCRRGCDGLSAVPGSCGTYDTSRPRSARSACAPGRRSPRRRSRTLPDSMREPGPRVAEQSLAPTVVLPLPDSPTSPRISPAARSNRRPRRSERARAHVDPQIRDARRGFAQRRAPRSRPSVRAGLRWRRRRG